jgi:hypothetical protein
MSASMLADGLTATLQQGNNMTAFYGVDAFKQAYEAASDGAVITLSAGLHNNIESITKKITLIGNLAFMSNNESSKLSSITISADDVKIEGIYFSQNVTIGNVTNCHIKRCQIMGSLLSTGIHNNTLIDQCFVKIDQAISNGYNYAIKNSTIGYFNKMNTVNNIAYITNCYVAAWFHRNWSDSKVYRPCAIYKNNVLCIHNSNFKSNYTIYLSSPSEFYFNRFQKYASSASSEYQKYYVELYFNSGCLNSNNTSNGASSSGHANSDNFTNLIDMLKFHTDSFSNIGSDGTPIGTTGGTGFSEYPAIPRITSKTIDSNVDANGKINVKITVKAEQ